MTMTESARAAGLRCDPDHWVDHRVGAAATADEPPVLDPFAWLLSSPAAFLVEHLTPIRDLVEALTVDSSAIETYARGWDRIASALNACQRRLNDVVVEDTSGWQGIAADAYRGKVADQLDALRASAIVADAISGVAMSMSRVVGFVREEIRRRTAELVRMLTYWAAETTFTLGLGLPFVVSQMVGTFPDWADQVNELLDGLNESMRCVEPALAALADVFTEITRQFDDLPSAEGLFEPHTRDVTPLMSHLELPRSAQFVSHDPDVPTPTGVLPPTLSPSSGYRPLPGVPVLPGQAGPDPFVGSKQGGTDTAGATSAASSGASEPGGLNTGPLQGTGPIRPDGPARVPEGRVWSPDLRAGSSSADPPIGAGGLPASSAPRGAAGGPVSGRRAYGSWTGTPGSPGAPIPPPEGRPSPEARQPTHPAPGRQDGHIAPVGPRGGPRTVPQAESGPRGGRHDFSRRTQEELHEFLGACLRGPGTSDSQVERERSRHYGRAWLDEEMGQLQQRIRASETHLAWLDSAGTGQLIDQDMVAGILLQQGMDADQASVLGELLVRAEAAEITQEYDIAVSFAAEQRAYVEANVIAARALSLKVFYDRDMSNAWWGRNFILEQRKIYGQLALHFVPFISTEYLLRPYPRDEFAYAMIQAINRGDHYILPVLVGQVVVPPEILHPHTVYLRAEDHTPAELADIMKQTVDNSRAAGHSPCDIGITVHNAHLHAASAPPADNLA